MNPAVIIGIAAVCAVVIAIIAATNSKGKNSSKVDVDYCPVSHVKKPNGAKAGMVIYEGYATAVVSPDESFCESIRVQKK